jgi:hypothetical protein
MISVFGIESTQSYTYAQRLLLKEYLSTYHQNIFG